MPVREITQGTREVLYRLLIALIVLVNAGLTLAAAVRELPTADEVQQVPAGLNHWRTATFAEIREVPPLARMISALPVLAWPSTGSTTVWGEGATPGGSDAGVKNLTSLFDYRLARAPGFVWWALGAWLIYRWAVELYGTRAGCFALALWAIQPGVIAREQTATPDLPCAVICIAATYAFWRWLRRPSWGLAAVVGVLLGTAQLVDLAALALPVAWFVAGMSYLLLTAKGEFRPRPAERAAQAALSLVIGLWVINTGYGLSGSGLALKDFRFASHALSGNPAADDGDDEAGGNRFQGTWAGDVVVPLPTDYVAGIDLRWRDAEQRARASASSLPRPTDRGAFQPVVLLAKAPIGLLGLVVAAGVSMLLVRASRDRLADELVVWIPPAIIIAMAVSPIGFLFSMPVMLLLPIPFVVVGASRLSLALDSRRTAAILRAGPSETFREGEPPCEPSAETFREGEPPCEPSADAGSGGASPSPPQRCSARRAVCTAFVAALAVWSIASGLVASRRPLRYVNETRFALRDLAARARSATPGDSGQDLFALRNWLEANPEVRLAGTACDSLLDLRDYGVDGAVPPVLAGQEAAGADYSPRGGPRPGYYVLDHDHLQRESYQYLSGSRHIAHVGDSLEVFRVEAEYSDKVRKQSGLATDRDLTALKKWLADHPEADPIGLACRTTTDLKKLGIESATPPMDPGPALANAPWFTTRTGPFPGYFALDRHSLSLARYGYFNQFEPIARVSDSIVVYHVTVDAAGRARHQMGRKPLRAGAGEAGADSDRGFIDRIYQDSEGHSFSYTVFVPYDYLGDRPYPAILFLHGAGEAGKKGRKYLSVTFPPAVEKQEQTFGFIAVVPQGHSGGWAVGGDDAKAAMEILAQVESEYRVDPDRVYLTGVSSGGSGVWEFAAAYPNRWAAIVPVACGGNTQHAPRVAHIPCWCFQNSYDLDPPASAARRMVAALRKAGGAPKYTEFLELTTDFWRGDPKSAHNAWDKAYSMPELYDWLIQQTRPRSAPAEATIK